MIFVRTEESGAARTTVYGSLPPKTRNPTGWHVEITSEVFDTSLKSFDGGGGMHPESPSTNHELGVFE